MMDEWMMDEWMSQPFDSNIDYPRSIAQTATRNMKPVALDIRRLVHSKGRNG